MSWELLMLINGRPMGAGKFPDALFTPTKKGDYWDWLDRSTTFKDVSQTIPATLDGDLVKSIKGKRSSGVSVSLNEGGVSGAVLDAAGGASPVSASFSQNWSSAASLGPTPYSDGLTVLVGIKAPTSAPSPVTSFMRMQLASLIQTSTVTSGFSEYRQGGTSAIGAFLPTDGNLSSIAIRSTVSGTGCDIYVNGVFWSSVLGSASVAWDNISGELGGASQGMVLRRKLVINERLNDENLESGDLWARAVA